ncbi:MAG: VCBS repeat-containing protein [Desulfobacterales bacterium]|nr:VCBS repeat-containing protein [Desulfobacterales bacterium]
MKISIFKTSRLLFLGLLTLAIITGSALSASAKQSRIAIVPFTMNAEKDLAFLQEGILSMLSSRLSWENKVSVIARQETAAAVKTVAAPLNEANARKIGAMLKADYVLFGSLTIFGNSVSLDAKMVDISNARPPLSFYNQSKGMEEVIPRLNLFAEEINEKVFGRKIAVRQLPQQRVPTQRPSQYMHPERLLSGEFIESEEDVEGGKTPFVMTGRGDVGPGFWKSKNFRMQIKGLALGDVDGDGKTETVMITNQEVHIYRSENDRFTKIKEIEGEKYYKYLSVDVADINKDGKAEIFVTCLNKSSKSLESFVLEFNGSDFKTVADNENWYFRVISRPVLGPMLVGQKMGISELFMPGVYELAWTGSRYKPRGKVATGLPENITVFGFTMGDLLNTKGDVVAAFDEEERLRIYTTSGSQEWKSEDRFGGSENYIDIDFQDKEGDYESRVYLPHRLYIVDLNKDGKTELITVKNKSISGHLFRKFRHYSGAWFESLSWDGLGLAKNWHTRKVSGYICDYAIGDIDNDGELELVAAIVSKRDVIGQKAKSSVITYDLAPLMGE